MSSLYRQLVMFQNEMDELLYLWVKYRQSHAHQAVGFVNLEEAADANNRKPDEFSSSCQAAAQTD